MRRWRKRREAALLLHIFVDGASARSLSQLSMFVLLKRQRRVLLFALLLILLIFFFILQYSRAFVKRPKFFYLRLVDYHWKPLGNLRLQLEENNQPAKKSFTDAVGQIRLHVAEPNELIEISINGYFHQFLAASEEILTVRLPTIHRNTTETFEDADDDEAVLVDSMRTKWNGLLIFLLHWNELRQIIANTTDC